MNWVPPLDVPMGRKFVLQTWSLLFIYFNCGDDELDINLFFERKNFAGRDVLLRSHACWLRSNLDCLKKKHVRAREEREGSLGCLLWSIYIPSMYA